LDTDIFISIRRGRPTSVLDRFSRLHPGDAVVSVITYGELIYGIRKKEMGQAALDRLSELVQLIKVRSLPSEAAEVYGLIRAARAVRGEMIGSNDLWIAAHAMASDLILVSNNESEFRRVPGLRFENWAR
jgi:tRNA(fMet)-specific endonuclease VapC